MRETDFKKTKRAGAPNEPAKMKVRATREVIIRRPQEEVYAFWRNFENLPKFMQHLEEVTIKDKEVSHWKFKGPAGKTFEWDAQITSDRPSEFISWRSLENSEVEHAGSVEFQPLSLEETRVQVTLAYNPPAGMPGHQVAEWTGAAPEQEMEEDLLKLKESLEKAA
jgi:uncharacterized membrane protein